MFYEFVAGFGPKDLIGFSYIPIYVMFLLGSILLWLLSGRKSHPYIAALLIPPLALIITPAWIIYDVAKKKLVDQSQVAFIMGVIITGLLLKYMGSNLVPETEEAINEFLGISVLFTAFIYVLIVATNKYISLKKKYAMMVLPILLVSLYIDVII